MPIVAVDDPGDPRLVELAGLTDAEARARTETAHGCFVAEGLLALEAVLTSRYPLRSVLVAHRKLDRVVGLLEQHRTGHDVDVFVGDLELLQAVTGFPIHRGVVASAGRLPLREPASLLTGARRVLLLESVNDHENLGALFRNAAAFAVDAVLVDPTCADPLYRRSVRVSVGHVLHVPWTRVPSTTEALTMLRAAGCTTLALSPSGEVTLEDAVARHRQDRIAWLVGAEGAGLAPESLTGADTRVRIPLADGVDSLNVATAAAVALALSPG